MAGFIVRRLISSFLVVVLTSMFVFALFFLGPSNPAGVADRAAFTNAGSVIGRFLSIAQPPRSTISGHASSYSSA
jgi:ABC-type dipeptide/oligopeptide/nickel transport system permease component